VAYVAHGLNSRAKNQNVNTYMHLVVEKTVKKKKKFREEVMAHFPFIVHGPHRKRHGQQFFYCCMCIHCSDNFFTEPLPSNDRGIHNRDTDW
jgi:hypothetical protein